MKRPGRPGRLPLRAGWALVTTGVFAVLGCGMLALNLLSARQLIQANRDLLRPLPLEPATPVVPSPETGFPAPEGGVPTSGSSTPAALTTPAQGFDDFRNTILSDLLTRSLLLLAVFTLLAALLAWWAGRRSLARLHQVTATARRISADRSLDERLALDGPYDEIRELGDTFDAMLDRLGPRLHRAAAVHRARLARAAHPADRAAHGAGDPARPGPGAGRPAARGVERALAANARTESLISALLTLARGESGTLHPRRTDLADAASAAARELAEEAGTAGVALTVSPGPGSAGG
ncbi:hypothetical protein GCM10020229_55750 [Kitasatospora albolonga]|uniref:HAMP domain-containing protein n=1 Tax=Kitasatospora albolonga TaxID=68173 RepID=UPI0031E788E8